MSSVPIIRIPGAGLKILEDRTKPAIQISASAPAQVAIASFDDDQEIVEADEKLPQFPQFTGLLHDLCEAMSPDIPYPYLVTSAFTHAGIGRSGLDSLADEPHIQPRLYSVLVGKPGNGKSAAMNEVGKIMKELKGDSYKAYSSINSGPALVDSFNDLPKEFITKIDAGAKLGNTPARILLAPDEFKKLFDQSKSESGGKYSMLGEMLSLYEGNVAGNRVRGMKIKIHLENAHLAALGGTTESGYAAMWLGTAGASDGLQSRIAPVGLDAYNMPAKQRPADAVGLSMALPKLVEYMKSPGHLFSVTDAAWKLFADWWEKKDQDDPSVVRLDGIAKRVMIILAGTNAQQCVDEGLVTQAIQFADYIHFCRSRYNPADSLTIVQAMENLIVRCYEKHGDMSRNICRRRTNADRKPGGMGPFLTAFKNLVMGDKLAPVSKAHKGDVFHLCK